MIKVDVRNETASNHSKQTQMGGLGDESGSGKTREINKVYFHMHCPQQVLMGQLVSKPKCRCKSYRSAVENRIGRWPGW
jgi:hypothetical protein